LGRIGVRAARRATRRRPRRHARRDRRGGHRRCRLGGPGGGLKAYRGAHEVITTIMLNWIAIYTTQYLFAVSGPLTDTSVGNGVSKTIKTSAQYPGMWGVVQQIHIGIFLALACAVAYYVILNRTTLGYE